MGENSTVEHELAEEELNEEVDAIEKVIHAMLFYDKHASLMFKRQLKCLKSMNIEDRRILAPILQSHINKALTCAKANQAVFEKIVNAGARMFGDSLSLQRAYEGVGKSVSASEHYMSKARSTLKQIVRDWSKDGETERRSCYDRSLLSRYPETANRNEVTVLIPGCGLGRLNFDLMQEGFSVCGNEFSFFMILASNYLLNFCKEIEEHTIYPYLLEFSNVWCYEDSLKPIKFPDISPVTNVARRPNNFSMCAGDFVGVYGSQSDVFDCVLTVFFLDTAKNPLEYMRIVYKILKPGGCWIHFGPLTYHFEYEDDNSMELPFSEICRIAEHIGFKMVCVEGNGINSPSSYTENPNSMLKYQYHCGFIECTKPPS